jgi:hypothetical protein
MWYSKEGDLIWGDYHIYICQRVGAYMLVVVGYKDDSPTTDEATHYVRT